MSKPKQTTHPYHFDGCSDVPPEDQELPRLLGVKPLPLRPHSAPASRNDGALTFADAERIVAESAAWPLPKKRMLA